jgi:predicted RNase H-like nuclease (RuvC/YqgF family)
MGFEDILEAVERVGDEDEIRRTAFQEEFDRYEAGELRTFSRTREALANERQALDRLEEELDDEIEHLDELAESSEFLTVDQAVEHRDKTIEKLERHNEHLRTFHEEISAALRCVESNLDALEREGPEAVDTDPEPHFDRAREALQSHNAAVEDLDRNLLILNAYLL